MDWGVVKIRKEEPNWNTCKLKVDDPSHHIKGHAIKIK
jgi:hypothetical protein